MERIQPAGASEPPLMPPPQMQLRARREIPTRDSVNARQVEHWRTDVPQPFASRPDMNKQAPFYDMNPVFTRNLDAEAFRQNQLFVVDNEQIQKNPYFQKYDVTSDPRNLARELKSAVVETKTPRSEDESRRLFERGFQHQYVPRPQTDTTVSKALEAFEQMRPKLNDMKAFFR